MQNSTNITMTTEQGSAAADDRPHELVVFDIRRPSECSECKEELFSGGFLFLKDRQPLCLECADLDHLEYLPRGNAALSRRARKHSKLNAVVLRWSSTRKRYERQGLLVESAAVEKAMAECHADAELREARRLRNAERLAQLDEKYVADFAAEIHRLYPGCPGQEAVEIAAHTCEKYSRRVGRSALAKRLDAEAIHRAVQAHVRHAHTRYDDLLAQGRDRDWSRDEVADDVSEVLTRWRGITNS